MSTHSISNKTNVLLLIILFGCTFYISQMNKNTINSPDLVINKQQTTSNTGDKLVVNLRKRGE